MIPLFRGLPRRGYLSIGELQPQPGAEESYRPSCMSICRKVCLIIVAVGILAVLSVFIWAYHHDSGYPFEDPKEQADDESKCLIAVRESDIHRFKELVNDKKYDSLFVTFETSQNVRKSNKSYIYKPQNWIWARKNSPILDLPSSYPMWSFGILDIRTKRNVTFNLELSPPGCDFEWGDVNTQITVGKALVNFTRSEKERYNWCYAVRLRDVNKFPVLEKDFSFFVQDLGYKCCHNHHVDGTDQIIPFCPKEVIVQRIWTDMPFTIAFLTLLIFPNILVYIYQFLSFKSHVYWTHHRHKSDEDDDTSLDYQSKTSEWIHTDYKSPVTFLSFLRSYSNSSSCPNSCCMFVKRFIRVLLTSVGIVSISLLFVVIPVFICLWDEYSFQMLHELIKNDVPIGFLSIMFPFKENHHNFMSLMSGPFVFFSVYAFSATIYLIVLCCSFSGETINKTKLDTGKFSLNLDVVEKYGRIHTSKHYRYGLFETFHANARAIFRWSFWKELMVRVIGFEGRKCLQISLIPFAIVFSTVVHCTPFLFASLLILSNLLHKINEGLCCNSSFLGGLTVAFISYVHLGLVYFFTIIYFGSAEFVSFVISFCALSIIIFPSVATGLFVYALIALFYVMKRFRDVARKYASLRDVAIRVSQSLDDKCKCAEARVEERRNGNCLFISGVNILHIRYIVIVQFPTQMKMNNFNGFHCHLYGKVLKILTPRIVEDLTEVKISGVSVRIGEVFSNDGRTILKVDTGGMELKIDAVSSKTLESQADAVVSDAADSCFVIYRNGLPGIPRELLDRIIDEYMPVGAERISAFLWFLVVLGVVIWVFSIIIYFNQMEQMNVIIQSLILVVLVRLSDVMRMFSIDVDEGQKMKIKEADLRLSVLEFWTEKRFKPNKDDHVAKTTPSNIPTPTTQSQVTSHC